MPRGSRGRRPELDSYTRSVEPRREALVRSESAQATLALGRRIGELAEPGDVVALIGPLGAGKTVFAKGVADGLGVTSVVNSPTFILMNEHQGRLRLFHIDAYRLEDPDDAAAAGLLDERQGTGVTVIEWADRIEPLLPVDRLDLALEPDRDGDRIIRVHPRGSRHEELAAALAPGARSAA